MLTINPIKKMETVECASIFGNYKLSMIVPKELIVKVCGTLNIEIKSKIQ